MQGEKRPPSFQLEGSGGVHTFKTKREHGGYTAAVFIRQIVVHDLVGRSYDPKGVLTIGDAWYDNEQEEWVACTTLRFANNRLRRLAEDQHIRLAGEVPTALPHSLEWYDQFSAYLEVERTVIAELEHELTASGIRLPLGHATYYEG